jgi:hypothetical protein
MRRKARAIPGLLCLFATLGAIGATEGNAQSAPGDVASVVGAPFSGVGTQQITRNFVDGNRMVRGGSARYYRDSQGRTRVERELPSQLTAANPGLEPMAVTINDPVSGEVYRLHPQTKTADVFKRGAAARIVQPPVAAPPFAAVFAGRTFGPQDPGWSSAVSLGEKVVDGVRAVGTRRAYTIPPGTTGNEKPILLTVEQWFSPDLGVLLLKSGRASTGGDSTYRLEHIALTEPDPALFAVPAGYTRRENGAATAGP